MELRELDDRTAELVALVRELRTRVESRAAERDRERQANAADLDRLRRRVDELERECDDARGQLQAMQRTRGWRFLQLFYYRPRARLRALLGVG